MLTEQCPRCGTFEEDWIDPKTRMPHDTPVWAAIGKQCPGCAEVARMEEHLPKRAKAAHVVLVPFDTLEEHEEVYDPGRDPENLRQNALDREGDVSAQP